MSKNEKTVAELLAGGVTPAQISQWKKEHGDVFRVSVPGADSNGVSTGYFRKPSLSIIGAASRYVTSDPIKFGEIVFNGCWLGGDPEMQHDDETRVSCMGKLSELFKIREAQLEKL